MIVLKLTPAELQELRDALDGWQKQNSSMVYGEWRERIQRIKAKLVSAREV
jgi:hypothetical protein